MECQNAGQWHLLHANENTKSHDDQEIGFDEIKYGYNMIYSIEIRLDEYFSPAAKTIIADYGQGTTFLSDDLP